VSGKSEKKKRREDEAAAKEVISTIEILFYKNGEMSASGLPADPVEGHQFMSDLSKLMAESYARQRMIAAQNTTRLLSVASAQKN